MYPLHTFLCFALNGFLIDKCNSDDPPCLVTGLVLYFFHFFNSCPAGPGYILPLQTV